MMEMLELSSSARTAEVMKRCVLFREYEASWPQLFEAEKILLLGQIGQHLLTIEHIGSTSVPGLSAKPIIDMLLGVETLDQADASLEPLHRTHPKTRAAYLAFNVGLPRAATRNAIDHQLDELSLTLPIVAPPLRDVVGIGKGSWEVVVRSFMR